MADNIKTIDELKRGAWMQLPDELQAEVDRQSIAHRLTQTVGDFVSILERSGGAPLTWKEALDAQSVLAPHWFFQHLCVFSGVEESTWYYLAHHAEEIFPNGQLTFLFDGNPVTYAFEASPTEWTTLRIDGDHWEYPRSITPCLQDAIMVLLFAGLNPSPILASLQLCNIGAQLGNAEGLKALMSRRYLETSQLLAELELLPPWALA